MTARQEIDSPALAAAMVRLRSRRNPARLPVVIAAVALLGAVLLAACVGPVSVSPAAVTGTVLAHLPLLHVHTTASPLDQAIVWDLRLPRVLLAALVGAMLASSGAAYQGVLRNSLADPYLLGIAAGAGLGATIAIVAGADGSLLLPAAAFLGAVVAVLMTFAIAAAGSERASGYAVILAGVAVAAMLTSIQTYLQQQHTEQIRQIYNWLLGSFSQASWSDVRLALPYILLSLACCKRTAAHSTCCGSDPRRPARWACIRVGPV